MKNTHTGSSKSKVNLSPEKRKALFNEFKLNPRGKLDEEVKGKSISWVKNNKAMLIVHGIGDQLPLETLDSFARGIIGEYEKAQPELKLSISHQLVEKFRGNGTDVWFENTIRISCEGSNHFIDIYEYYWANYTQDKAGWDDINNWLQTVVTGGKNFYNENKALAETYRDDGFEDRSKGFSSIRYKFFLQVVGKSLLALHLLRVLFLKLLNRIPVIGEFAQSWLESALNGKVNDFNNVVGDIVVYNVYDPKSKFYSVRSQILDGAVNAVRFLIEREEEPSKPYYDSVVVAGHSLGTQIAYDAINRINLLVNQDKIKNYSGGVHTSTRKKISEHMNGFITFGSPLDKIAFFLREIVPEDNYVRRQLLTHYHGFKQLNWYALMSASHYPDISSTLVRHFDTIEWKNYHDKYDYVSGSLDYYKNLKNIDCRFPGSRITSFTHSNYWTCENFYKDVICSFLTS